MWAKHQVKNSIQNLLRLKFSLDSVVAHSEGDYKIDLSMFKEAYKEQNILIEEEADGR